MFFRQQFLYLIPQLTVYNRFMCIFNPYPVFFLNWTLFAYPDNSIRIYECLDNVRMISKLLSSNGVIIDEISVQGENLETYFENLIGGRKNV